MIDINKIFFLDSMNYPINTKGLLILSILLLISTGCSHQYQASWEAEGACKKWAKKGGNFTTKTISKVGMFEKLEEGERWVKPSWSVNSETLKIKELSVPVRICVTNKRFYGKPYGDQLWIGGYKNKIGKKGKTVTVDIRKFGRIDSREIYWNKKNSKLKYDRLLLKNRISEKSRSYERNYYTDEGIARDWFEGFFQLDKKFRY